MKIRSVRYRRGVRSTLQLFLLLMFVSTPTLASYESALSAYKNGDYVTAYREWRIMASRGFKKPQYYLGEMYARGQGVPQDHVQAVRWYRHAALRGYPEAQVNLAQRYFLGLGVKQDFEEAAAWAKIAAKAGHPDAMHLLGVLYLIGRGVEQDNVLAYFWFGRAAAQGHEKAKETLSAIADRMSFGEINRAKRMLIKEQE